MKKIPLYLIMLLCMALVSCSDDDAANTPVPQRNLPLVIMHDNDVHCAVECYPLFAGLRDAIVAADTAYVATVSSGDFLQGGAMGGFSNGEYIVNMMNAVGYDAVTIGNHEFDYGVPRLLEMAGKLNTTVTCVNFINTDTKTEYYAPYVIKQMGPKKVAFVGTVTPSTIISETYAFYDEEGNPLPYDLQESETVQLIQGAVNKARAEGADYVVLLSHLGEFDRGSEVYSLPVISQTTGINAVLDGHTHSVIEEEWYLNAKGDSVLLTQTGTKFSHFGKLIIYPDGRCHSELITDADMKALGYENARAKATLDSLNVLVAGTMQKKVMHSAFSLTILGDNGKRAVRNAETNLGDYVTDAIREVTGSQVALINGGGLRDNLPVGDVIYKNLYDAMPYSENVSMVKITGETLLELMEMSCRDYPTENGSFLQVSGMRYTFNPDASPRVQSLEVLQNDGTYVPVVKNDKYTVSSTNYVISIIEALPSGKDCEHLADDVKGDLECVIQFSEGLGGEVPAIYAKPQGRISVVGHLF